MKRALLGGLVAWSLLLAAVALAGAEGPPRPARIWAPSPEDRTRLGQLGVAPEGVDVEAGWVWAVLTAEQAARLRRAGFQVAWEAGTLDFPPDDSAYHNYAETLADLADLAARHPDIVRLVTIGTSWEGRLLQGVKITDRPDEDEGEPGALFFALTHAREHLTTEQALYIAHHFAEGYGVDPSVTNLVNHRVLWVFPNVNPDGGEYDVHSGFAYEWWRPNRRPIAPPWVYGVDLNRNYGYQWGCCGGSSPYPGDETYRGPEPFSEPETRAIRDFVLAHPEVTVSLSLHTFGEQVLWPWSYTYAPVPDPVDRATLEHLGQAMAATNGYRAQQASDLYVADGTSDDWLYGERGIIAFTMELYPRLIPPGWYPPDEVIPQETARNRAAVELLAAMALDPRRAGGGPGDVLSPTVSLTTTTRYWPLSTTMTLTAQAQDDAGGTLVWAQEVPTGTLGMQTAPAYTWALPTGEEPALRTFVAWAYDAAHNLGQSAPYTVAVGMPHGRVSPAALGATLAAGEVATHTLALQNAGHGPLTWALAGPPPPWLALDPVEGEVPPGEGQPITLTFQAGEMAWGVYTATLAFAWNDPFAPQGEVQVWLQVEPPRRRYLPLALRGG
ncbi:MAG: zinc carboxypeptidase [Anaerolineae bacterium]|nr:zinc carboxypeptidase [Anaerolineae bacterium]